MKKERLEELVRTYGPTMDLDTDFARLRGLILAVERETVERWLIAFDSIANGIPNPQEYAQKCASAIRALLTEG